jgi:hypothetical protein
VKHRIPDWAIQSSWWVSGIFATGAAWYFLSKGDYLYTSLSIAGAVGFAVLAVSLHRRRDAWDRSNQREDGGANPVVPSIFGEPYAVARALLIRQGWIPRERHWSHGDTAGVQSGNGPHFWNKGYHELAYCSGTGYALCRFEFNDSDGNALVVITSGEAYDDNDDRVRVFRVMRNPQNEEGAYGDTLGAAHISSAELGEVLPRVRSTTRDPST